MVTACAGEAEVYCAWVFVVTIERPRTWRTTTVRAGVAEGAGVIVVTGVVVVCVDTAPRLVRLTGLAGAGVSVVAHDRRAHAVALCTVVPRSALAAIGALAVAVLVYAAFVRLAGIVGALIAIVAIRGVASRYALAVVAVITQGTQV